ncbi:MAG: dihydrofolate reductase [Myxacorys californica WJT36-NPBG1]|jgi:dihydrofolate reductase|nr:dihydrofolate reductase [Myxacorys californica WJT36-NPBG1]
MPRIVVIAALASSNRVIGNRGKLPWSIPEDLRRFQQLTLHHTVIMGRKTWEFDLEKRPLKHRSLIVVSSTLSGSTPGIEVVRSLTDAIGRCQECDHVFIAGGASLYAQALAIPSLGAAPIADQLELTLIDGEYEGDVFFPPFRHLIGTHFELVKVEPRDGYRFETYVREGMKCDL